jgi:hypothetical protein
MRRSLKISVPLAAAAQMPAFWLPQHAASLPPLAQLRAAAAAAAAAACHASSSGPRPGSGPAAAPQLPDPSRPLRLMVCAADGQMDSALAQVVAALKRRHAAGVSVVGLVSLVTPAC